MQKYLPTQIGTRLFLIILFAFSTRALAQIRASNILVFYKTAGFYHSSIPTALKSVKELGKENGINVDTSADARLFSKRGLKPYGAIVFLNTTGDVLNNAQQRAFTRFIRNGNGFVGIHSAASTELGWEWYNDLVGAYLQDHPEVQLATIQVTDKTHPSTSFLPNSWQRVDEWYNLKNIRNHLKVLATIDENSYTGGKNGKGHPFAWFHEFEGGRSFYTSGGHTDLAYSEPLFLHHLLGGIRYALGINN